MSLKFKFLKFIGELLQRIKYTFSKKYREKLRESNNHLRASLIVNNFILLRNKLKKEGDFKTADKIRNDLKDRGIILEDTKSGTTYRFTKLTTA